MKLRLGDRVRDMYTGFEGIAVARCDFLYGCTRIQIEPTDLTDTGKMKDACYFDEQRVEIVKSEKKCVAAGSTAKTGGPHDDPQRSPDPK